MFRNYRRTQSFIQKMGSHLAFFRATSFFKDFSDLENTTFKLEKVQGFKAPMRILNIYWIRVFIQFGVIRAMWTGASQKSKFCKMEPERITRSHETDLFTRMGWYLVHSVRLCSADALCGSWGGIIQVNTHFKKLFTGLKTTWFSKFLSVTCQREP